MTPIATSNEPIPQFEPTAEPSGAGGGRGRCRPGSRLSRQQRCELAARFEQSGLSAARFARQAGVSSSSLLRWRSKFAGRRDTGSPPAGGFAQVQLAGVPAGHEPIVVRLEQVGLSVTVPVGTDALWLGRLLGSLREATAR